MSTLNFDSTNVPQAAPLEPVPTNWYNVKIIESETKPTSKGDGSYLALTLEIIDGEYKGRKAFDRLNLQNPNQVAVEIAQKTLSAICHSTGVIRVTDSQELHNIPMKARIVKRSAETGADGKSYDETNDVKGYKPIEGSSAPTGANGGGAPPWHPADAAPAAQTPPVAWKPPPPPLPAPVPSKFPPEAIAWAQDPANKDHPQAKEILASLAPPAWTPPAPTTGEKPPPPWAQKK